MKKFLLITGLIFFLGFACIFFFKKTVVENLKLKDKEVKNSWNSFNVKLTERDSVLNSQMLAYPDTLKYLITRSVSERADKDNSIEIVYDEYLLNNFIIRHLSEKDKKILEINKSLNALEENYNVIVKNYNVYISTFPNFIIAKKENFKKALYFNIEYGKDNEDPIKKSKELPEWAKGIDTAN
jgi:hypothetical protein